MTVVHNTIVLFNSGSHFGIQEILFLILAKNKHLLAQTEGLQRGTCLYNEDPLGKLLVLLLPSIHLHIITNPAGAGKSRSDKTHFSYSGILEVSRLSPSALRLPEEHCPVLSLKWYKNGVKSNVWCKNNLLHGRWLKYLPGALKFNQACWFVHDLKHIPQLTEQLFQRRQERNQSHSNLATAVSTLRNISSYSCDLE